MCVSVSVGCVGALLDGRKAFCFGVSWSARKYPITLRVSTVKVWVSFPFVNVIHLGGKVKKKSVGQFR